MQFQRRLYFQTTQCRDSTRLVYKGAVNSFEEVFYQHSNIGSVPSVAVAGRPLNRGSAHMPTFVVPHMCTQSQLKSDQSQVRLLGGQPEWLRWATGVRYQYRLRMGH